MTRILKNIPIIGTQFGNWVVVSDEVFKKSSNRDTYWKVKCKCGIEALRSASHLTNHKSHPMCKSCSQSERFRDTFALAYINRIIGRAKKISVDYDLTPDYLYDLFLKQEMKCALSGVEIRFTNSWTTKSNQTASLDRIDNSKGYTTDNVQWVHKDVNFMKGKLTQERFLELCSKISEIV